MRNRNRAGSFLTILLAVTGMFGTFLFLTYLLQTIDHYSPLKTGVAFLPLMAMNALAATQVASRLMPHVRTRLLVVPGLLLAALGVALFTQLTPDASYGPACCRASSSWASGWGWPSCPASARPPRTPSRRTSA